MKKNVLLLVITVICSISSIYGQQQTVENEYAAYFTLPRESLYLHLNKTTFLQGEEVWFKGYAYDQKNQLTSKATTNIHVGIYDTNGKQLNKALFSAEDGFMKGNLPIDSTYTTGTYYLKATTNWMKNFEEDNAFVQKIEVISGEVTKKKASETTEKYDVQFLPEGGHVVADTKNTMGFKAINETGKGVSVSGIVYDANNKEVTSFTSNKFGLGKFLFIPEAGQQYSATIELSNGEVITKTLPKAKTKGFSMIVTDPFTDNLILNFNTNTETLATNATQTYKVLIHQHGKQKTLEFSFEGNTHKAISVLKKDLFKGVNTITVFDDNNTPIIERLIFNADAIKETAVQVSKLNTLNDSILLSIKELKLGKQAHVSISILPELTESYQPQDNILSNFYLKPYVKGFVENPQYYFQNMDRKKMYELDILLLTQGWSRYTWQNIFEKKPNGFHRFENGITIKGTVNRPATGIDRLFMYATKNHAARFIEVDKDQKFTLNNLFLEEGEEIRFSYIDKKGVFKKPSVYIRFNVDKGEDSISKEVLAQLNTKRARSANFKVPANFFYENSEQLDAVVIESKNEQVSRDPTMIHGTVTNITEKEYYSFPKITDFIQFNGYNVFEDQGQVQITLRRRINLGSTPPTPLIFFDNVPLSDLNILYNYSMANVERIVIDKGGLGYGVRGAAGVIKIYSRKTPLFKSDGNGNKMYTGETAPVTFTPAKEYYAPKYASYLNNTFEKYGAISWLPMVTLKTTEATTFKIYDTRLKNITLFIEGIAEDGTLISEKKTIQIR